jgi:hypothetical protein
MLTTSQGLVIIERGVAQRDSTRSDAHECFELHRAGGLAEGHGFGPGRLFGDESISQGGKVWFDDSDAAGGSFHPIEYRGRSGTLGTR